jgi:hypothetical protein
MTDVKPTVIFLHYDGTGPAARLAQAVRAAVDLLGKAQPSAPASAHPSAEQSASLTRF